MNNFIDRHSLINMYATLLWSTDSEQYLVQKIGTESTSLEKRILFPKNKHRYASGV
jgi:hypothetical protein